MSEFEGKAENICLPRVFRLLTQTVSKRTSHGCSRRALALIWVIGTYAVIIGVLLVALAFRLKKHTMVALRNGR